MQKLPSHPVFSIISINQGSAKVQKEEDTMGPARFYVWGRSPSSCKGRSTLQTCVETLFSIVLSRQPYCLTLISMLGEQAGLALPSLLRLFA